MTRTEIPTTAGAGRRERVPVRIRIFVAGFLAAFVVCAVGGIEAWPLTGWRLFSALRHDRAESWLVITIDGSGNAQPLTFGELPRSYWWGTNLLNLFPILSPARQEAVCEAWVRALRVRGNDARQIQINRVSHTVDRTLCKEGKLVVPVLRYTCGDGSSRMETG